MSLRPLVKRLAYRSGRLAKQHRRANRASLTVAMFHRVLGEDDARHAGADPEWTVSARLFRQSLEFFREHYTVVSLADLERLDRGEELGDCPLLLTFDDGWADNAQVARPLLAELGLPAVVFVVSEAVDREEAFWQERVFSAWRRGTLSAAKCSAWWYELGGTATENWSHVSSVRGLVARLARLPGAERERQLASFAAALADPGPRQMISRAELAALGESGIAVGSHGATHAPLVEVADAQRELDESRAFLSEVTRGHVRSISYPHGRYDAALVERTRAAGYERIFTSDECLNPIVEGRLPALLGRINVAAHEITDAAGDLAPERLATWFFRREARCLARP